MELGEPVQKSVLIVDDNSDLRTLLHYALEPEGFKILLASNGKEALDVLSANEPPGLIILDLMMPVMSGWEFLDQKKLMPHLAPIPVLVCSASKDNSPQGVQFLIKPLDLDVLIEIVQRHCGT